MRRRHNRLYIHAGIHVNRSIRRFFIATIDVLSQLGAILTSKRVIETCHTILLLFVGTAALKWINKIVLFRAKFRDIIARLHTIRALKQTLQLVEFALVLPHVKGTDRN